LRKSSGALESRLWAELRGRRRDGLSHFADGAAEKDAARTAYLESKSWTVIRFTNADVVEDINAVIEAIWIKAMEMKGET